MRTLTAAATASAAPTDPCAADAPPTWSVAMWKLVLASVAFVAGTADATAGSGSCSRAQSRECDGQIRASACQPLILTQVSQVKCWLKPRAVICHTGLLPALYKTGHLRDDTHAWTLARCASTSVVAAGLGAAAMRLAALMRVVLSTAAAILCTKPCHMHSDLSSSVQRVHNVRSRQHSNGQADILWLPDTRSQPCMMKSHADGPRMLQAGDLPRGSQRAHSGPARTPAPMQRSSAPPHVCANTAAQSAIQGVWQTLSVHVGLWRTADAAPLLPDAVKAGSLRSTPEILRGPSLIPVKVPVAAPPPPNGATALLRDYRNAPVELNAGPSCA